MKRSLSAALGLLVCACSGLLPGSSGDLTDLEAFIAVPVHERFARAQDDGDRRFLGVYGFSLSVPGVPNYHEDYWPRVGVLPIPGTSDMVQSDRESELNDQAAAYALEYNRLLLPNQN